MPRAGGWRQCADRAIQIHGGYGYLTEYRVEQVWRDARITRIYEGTNGIQASTLVERALRDADGAPAQAFAADIETALADAAAPMAAALAEALAHWRTASEAALRRKPLGAAAVAYLRLSGLVALGAVWSRMEAAAEHAPVPARVRAAAEFTRRWLLPECAHLKDIVCSGWDPSAWPEAVFERP